VREAMYGIMCCRSILRFAQSPDGFVRRPVAFPFGALLT